MKNHQSALDENQYALDKIMRKVRRDKKQEKKAKQLKQARKMSRLGLLAILLLMLPSCAARQKQQYRQQVDSLVRLQVDSQVSENQRQEFSQWREKLVRQMQLQSTLIHSDSSISLMPDGRVQLSRGTLLFSNTNLHESAAQQSQEEQIQSRTENQQSRLQEESLQRRETLKEKKNPPPLLWLAFLS